MCYILVKALYLGGSTTVYLCYVVRFVVKALNYWLFSNFRISRNSVLEKKSVGKYQLKGK